MTQMRRKDRQLSEEQAYEILRQCEFATLSTVSPSGEPYGIPISPVLVEKTLYFHCALAGKKIIHITQKPWVCISCVGKTKLLPEDFSTLYESAVAFGKAEMVENISEKIKVLRALCVKYAASNMQNVDEAIARSIGRTGICKITIDSITGKAKQPKPEKQ